MPSKIKDIKQVYKITIIKSGDPEAKKPFIVTCEPDKKTRTDNESVQFLVSEQNPSKKLKPQLNRIVQSILTNQP